MEHRTAAIGRIFSRKMRAKFEATEEAKLKEEATERKLEEARRRDVAQEAQRLSVLPVEHVQQQQVQRGGEGAAAEQRAARVDGVQGVPRLA